MAVRRMDHVGIVVTDLAAAVDFFVAIGLERAGEGPVEGDWVDRVVGLDGVRAEVAFVQTPDGRGRVELVTFHHPGGGDGDASAPANAPGIRHITFAVDDLDAAVSAAQDHGGELVGAIERYRDVYRLCYVRGPEGIIVELAQELG